MIVVTPVRRKFRGMRGLGDNPLVAVPTYANCSPLDPACVAANEVLANNYDAAVAAAQAGNNYTQCLANAANAIGTAQIQSSLASCNGQFITQAPSGTPIPVVTSSQQIASGGSSSPSFSFSTDLGGNQMSVGGNWHVSITGASPNSSVAVGGADNTGSGFGPLVEGSTDSNGNFSMSGGADSGQVGLWRQVWTVGGKIVGNAAFTVVGNGGGSTPPSQAPSNSVVSQTTSGTTTSVNVPSATAFDLFGDTSNPINIGGFQIGEYTALGLAAAAVLVIMMMGKGRR